MNPKSVVLVLFTIISVWSCSQSDSASNDPIPSNNFYFPPVGSDEWDTIDLISLGWNNSEEQALYNYLEDTGTKAFIILKDSKIALEWYMNNHTQNDIWYWASAGKTLTAFTLGIAQQEGFLSTDDPSSNYLGNNWSSLSESEENDIKIIHHLTMTTGLDFNTQFSTFCTDPSCLLFLNAPGSYWYYHNAPYTLIDNIVTGAVGEDFEDYFQQKVADKIGMNGFWLQNGYNNIYRSDARSMARFGILCLNKGIWDTTEILNDEDYFEAMTSTSQNLNEAYGYLWWLNGKDSYRLPSSSDTYPGELIPNAPNDLIAGLGANDQKLYLVPSENLIILRMGNNGGQGQLGPSGYDNTLWQLLNNYMN